MRSVEERLELFYKQLNGLFIERYDHPTEIELHVDVDRERLFIWKTTGKFSRPCENRKLAKIWWGTKEGSKYEGKKIIHLEDVYDDNTAYEEVVAANRFEAAKKGISLGEPLIIKTLTALDELMEAEQEDAAFEKEFMLMQALQQHGIPTMLTETVNGSGEAIPEHMTKFAFIPDKLCVTSGSIPDPGAHYRFKYTVRLTEADITAKQVTINLDPFRIAAIYNMTGFPEQTALKKILCSGNRGYKDKRQDYLDIISAMERALQMLAEDEANAE